MDPPELECRWPYANGGCWPGGRPGADPVGLSGSGLAAEPAEGVCGADEVEAEGRKVNPYGRGSLRSRVGVGAVGGAPHPPAGAPSCFDCPSLLADEDELTDDPDGWLLNAGRLRTSICGCRRALSLSRSSLPRGRASLSAYEDNEAAGDATWLSAEGEANAGGGGGVAVPVGEAPPPGVEPNRRGCRPAYDEDGGGGTPLAEPAGGRPYGAGAKEEMEGADEHACDDRW